MMKRTNSQKQEFQRHVNAQIIDIGPAARNAMLKTGIPASFLLADYLIVSRFGTRRVALPFSTQLTRQNINEKLFGGPQDLWLHMLDAAQGMLRQYKSLRRTKRRPATFVRHLLALGYFGSNRADAHQAVELMKQFRLTHWDNIPARGIRLQKKMKQQADLLNELRDLAKRLTKARVNMDTALSHFRMAAA